MSDHPLNRDFRLLGNDADLPIGSTNICRICELHYIIGSSNDSAIHREEHALILKGGLPKEIRELVKETGWALAHNDGGVQRLLRSWSSEEDILPEKQEIGKRAVAFAMWCRARENGLPDADFEAYMYDHLHFIDVHVQNDRVATEQAAKTIQKWEKYGG